VFAAARPADAYEAAIPPRLDMIAAGHSVFANEATADWLLWKVPSLRGRVAYDVRFEVLTPRRIARLLAWRNLGPGWARAVAGYDLVVDDPAHVSRLVAAGGWHRVLVWHRVAVAERNRR
jgi:hypothetical protein